jgi:UBA/THIF-type NAD/FAD binding protein
MERYERNRIYVSEIEQQQIKDFRILLGGAGLGSNIAETALRLGFECITIVDGDRVEESNLNRQNYEQDDVGTYKADALKKRLLRINPEARIKAIPQFVNSENIREIIKGHNVAVNALDFMDDIPFLFDRICADHDMFVLHPFNVGYAGIVMVMHPEGPSLDNLRGEADGNSETKRFERCAVRHVTDYFNYWARPRLWIEEVLRKYEAEKEILPPPQLAIASSLVGGMCSSILFRISTGGFVKTFPRFYYYSEYDDLT